MHGLFLVAHYFPFFGLGLCAAFVQVAIFYRRKGSRLHWFWWFMAAASILSVAAWVLSGGYSSSEEWVRHLQNIGPH